AAGRAAALADDVYAAGRDPEDQRGELSCTSPAREPRRGGRSREDFVEADAEEFEHHLGVNLQSPVKALDWQSLVVAVIERAERHVRIELDWRESVTRGPELRIELAVSCTGDHPGNRARAGIGRLDSLLDQLKERSVRTRLRRWCGLEQLESRLGTDYLTQLGHEALGIFAGQGAAVQHD